MNFEELFRDFWWLLFPIFGMSMAVFGMLQTESRSQQVMRLIKSYVDQGKDPPPELLKLASQPGDYDMNMNGFAQPGQPQNSAWTFALEHPMLVWQVDAPDGAQISLGWTVDTDPAAPAVECLPAADRHSAVLRWPGRPFRLIIEVEGGTLDSTITGSVARISVQAHGGCRVRLTGAADESDLERSRQMLARRGFAGLVRQRADHAAELASYATSIEAPEPALVESFEWAKVHMDGLLVGTPGVGRCLVSGYAADRAAPTFVTEAACRVAFAQLAAGDRTGPRDTLKFLSLSQDEGGRVVEECSTGGEARFGDWGGADVPAARRAVRGPGQGELDFLSRRWAAIRRAFEVGIAGRPWEGDPSAASRWHAALVELQPLAEALGHPEVAEHLGAVADEARTAAGPATFLLEPAALGEFRAGRFDREVSTHGARPRRNCTGPMVSPPPQPAPPWRSRASGAWNRARSTAGFVCHPGFRRTGMRCPSSGSGWRAPSSASGCAAASARWRRASSGFTDPGCTWSSPFAAPRRWAPCNSTTWSWGVDGWPSRPTPPTRSSGTPDPTSGAVPACDPSPVGHWR